MDRKILHRFFEGTASLEEEKAVCDWAEASEENRRELLRERSYFDVLLLHPVKNKEKKAPTRQARHLFPAGEFLKIAAAIAVLVVSVLYIYHTMEKDSPLVAMNKIVVPSGQRANITLSDGTNIWLNACSELIYPATFTNDVRNVTLKGEAYFDVTKDTDHPFIMQTPTCDIKVLGTKFNLQTDESANEFSAALIEGSIELTNKVEPGPALLLSPMTKAEWKEGEMKIDSIRSLDNYRWTEGLICFENTRFADLMERFEKIYDIRIQIEKSDLCDYKCSGKCRVSDGIDFILQVLQRSTHFTFSRSDDNTIIYIKK